MHALRQSARRLTVRRSHRIPRMTRRHSHRTLTAWTLYISLLLGLFACGLHHGQMSGLQLSGLDGVFCSLGSQSTRTDLGESSLGKHMAQYACPLCSSASAAVAVNSFAWQWPQATGIATAPLLARSRAQPPPLQLRPALNPRASPALFLAAI